LKPLFTIHAGEYLVGAFLERKFKRLNVWIPLRDTGVDLLVSDERNRRAVSLQVKFSKDFLVTHMAPEFRESLRACGWWTINREKLVSSTADYWVFVLLGFASRSTDFVVVPRRSLLTSLSVVHGSRKLVQMYIWVTKDRRCWETRGLSRADQRDLADGRYEHRHRDWTKWLDNWEPIARLGRASG
jgi:hypothetical protein